MVIDLAHIGRAAGQRGYGRGRRRHGHQGADVLRARHEAEELVASQLERPLDRVDLAAVQQLDATSRFLLLL